MGKFVFGVSMKKSNVKKERIIAQLSINGAADLTQKEKTQLSVWLLTKSREVCKDLSNYDKRFKARLILTK